MFDTRVVGKKIMESRKALNLTQMNLADELGVSYQAVSNWERGNAMPDISKLSELASILKISIDELLGDNKHTVVVKKIIEHPEDQDEIEDFEELEGIAPLLKPEDNDRYLDKLVEKNGMEMKDIIELAPFLSSGYLERIFSELDIKVQVKDIISLAPFVSDDTLEKISNGILENESYDSLSALAPFLKSRQLNDIVMKKLETDDVLLVDLCPFLSEDTNHVLAEKLMASDRHKEVADIAPFLKSETIDLLVDSGKISVGLVLPFVSSGKIKDIANHAISNNDLDTLDDLAPFLPGDFLDEMVLQHLESYNEIDYSRFYPFLKSSTLNIIAERIIAEKGMKGLSHMAPFL